MKNTIQLKCPKCNAVGRGTEAHLQKQIKCPKCKQAVRLVRLNKVQQSNLPPKKEKVSAAESKDVAVSRPPSVKSTENPVVIQTESSSRSKNKRGDLKRSGRRGQKRKQPEIDSNLIFITVIGLVGILILGGSTFLSWVDFGKLSIKGVSNSDGKIVIGVTVVSMLALILGLAEKRLLPRVLSIAQVWNVTAVIWIGWLIWTIESMLNSNELDGNPFAALMLASVGPGIGLYLGLLGSVVATVMIGFVLFRIATDTKNIMPSVAAYLFGIAIGAVIVFIIEYRTSHSKPLFDIPESRKISTNASDVLNKKIDSAKEGVQIEYYSSGEKRAEVSYKNGVKHGPRYSWHKSGEKKGEQHYKHGEKDGVETNWHISGQIETRELWNKGRLVNFSSWKPDGTPCPITKIVDGSGIAVTYWENGNEFGLNNYKDGLKHGQSVGWFDNGNKSMEFNYKKGKLDGPSNSWYSGDKKASEGVYKNGKEDGLWTRWYLGGQMASQHVYNNGEKISSKEYEYDTSYLLNN